MTTRHWVRQTIALTKCGGQASGKRGNQEISFMQLHAQEWKELDRPIVASFAQLTVP